MSINEYFTQDVNIREFLLIVTKIIWLYAGCTMIYGMIYQYIIRKREKYWENAHIQDIMNALINILHETNYFEWHKLYIYQIIVTRAITYTDIIRAYDELSMKDRIIFLKHCKTNGLYPMFIKILYEHSPQ